jgi:anaerobic selenocysteine-containing dehydrogenase
VQQSTQAIPPLGEARSNVWLFSQLAQRMGFTEDCFGDTPEKMIRQALNVGKDGFSRNPGMEHITADSLAEQGHIRLSYDGSKNREVFLPFSSGSVPTATGKIEFYSEALAAAGEDPLPTFHPPAESRLGADAVRFPLEFLPRKADHSMNSTFANLDGHRAMESGTNQRLEIHPSDAAPRGIASGDLVRIWNDRGTLELTALLSERVPAGVVAGRLDWSKQGPEGKNVNVLTSERLTDIGRAATFYSTLVEVARA